MEQISFFDNNLSKLRDFHNGSSVKCSFIGHVFFGSPSMNCAGHGICRITEVEEDYVVAGNWRPCQTIAQINKDTNGHYLFQVLKSTVNARLYKRQFGCPYFKVEEDFDMASVFKSSQSSIIKSGQYPFWEDENFIYIDFSAKIDPSTLLNSSSFPLSDIRSL